MELIEIIENEVNGVIWVIECWGINGVICSTNSYPKQSE